jgi:hypothetical protein
MKLQGAVIKEQGVTFAVVIVKKHVVDQPGEANRTINALSPAFGFVPVVLMAQDSRGVPTYFGRRDIANFLANVPMEAIPWQEYNIS